MKTTRKRGATPLLGALAILTALALMSVVAASASASTVPVWKSNGTHMQYGTEVAYSGSSASGLNITWHRDGLTLWVQCDGLTASGTIENYAYGRAGTFSNSSAKFHGCRVAEVGELKGCTVASEIPLKIASGKYELSNSPYPGGGLTIPIEMSFELKNCPSHVYEFINWTFWGSVSGNEGLGAWPGEVLIPSTKLSVNGGGTGAEIEFGLNAGEAGSSHYTIGQEEIGTPHNPGHHYWYTGGGQRRGEGAPTLVSAGSPLSIKGSGSNLTIEGTVSGTKTTISCSGGNTSGSVENPAGGGDGTANVAEGFTGCKVVKPEGKGCAIPGGSISTASMGGALFGTGASAPMKLTPSKYLAEITIQGCSVEGLNNTFPLSGVLYAEPVGFSWWLPKSLNETNQVKLAGQKAIVSGAIGAESSGGEKVFWTE